MPRKCLALVVTFVFFTILGDLTILLLLRKRNPK